MFTNPSPPTRNNNLCVDVPMHKYPTTSSHGCTIGNPTLLKGVQQLNKSIHYNYTSLKVLPCNIAHYGIFLIVTSSLQHPAIQNTPINRTIASHRPSSASFCYGEYNHSSPPHKMHWLKHNSKNTTN
uniref:Uncharacterized protein n=1 Tax=Sphaerodactylus townsendi TaxID=933632 RepID=A0ACB8FDG8_9SAUR